MPELGRAFNYPINIQPTDNKGFTVQIGCANFSYESGKSMIRDLEAFLDDPEGWEKKYNTRPGRLAPDEETEAPLPLPGTITEERPRR